MSLIFYFEEPILTLGGHFHFYFKQCVKKKKGVTYKGKIILKLKKINRALLIHYEKFLKIYLKYGIIS
jgi:hypothetical protein